VKENRPLLIFLGVLLAIVLISILPDYFECDGAHWLPKSSGEIAAEAAQRSDVRESLIQHHVRNAILGDIVVDYSTLVVPFHGTYPPGAAWFMALNQVWEASYINHHGLSAKASPCLRMVFRDEHGRTIYSKLNKSSTYSVFFNQ
jgi:hypothetical protein